MRVYVNTIQGRDRKQRWITWRPGDRPEERASSVMQQRYIITLIFSVYLGHYSGSSGHLRCRKVRSRRQQDRGLFIDVGTSRVCLDQPKPSLTFSLYI